MKRILLAGWLSLLAILAAASNTSAHAIVIRTEPADGMVLENAPPEIKLWFNEAILLDFTTIELVDGDGQRISVLPSRIPPVQSTEETLFGVTVHLPSLAPNAYRLSWRTIASDDLHASSGSMVFGVQNPADLAPEGAFATAPAPLEVWLRWLNLGALASVIGALAVIFLIFPTLRPTEVDRSFIALHGRVNTLALAACAIAFLAGIGLMLVQASDAGAAWWQIITQASYSSRSILRAGLIILLFVIVARRFKQTNLNATTSIRFVLLVLVCALVTLESLNSHVASVNSSFIPVIANAIHLLAAGVWGGGLIIFAVAIVPLLRGTLAEQALVRSVMRGFGRLAALSLGALVITGLYNSGVQVASLDALLVTLYGQTLLIKIGLALCIAMIGLWNSAMLHPRVAEMLRAILHRPTSWTLFGTRHLWQTVVIESIGAVSLILLAALLGATTPARGPEFDPPNEQAEIIPSISTNVSDLFVSFSIKPNRPGQNFISLGVFDTRRPAPAPIDRVTLQLSAPDATRSAISLDAEPRGNGRYEISGNAINASGIWDVMVIISRRGLPDTTAMIPWTVFEPPPPVKARPVWVSNEPLAPVLNLIVLGMIFSLAGILIILWLRQPSTSLESIQSFKIELRTSRKE